MTYTLETTLNGEKITREGFTDLYETIDEGNRLVSEGSGKVTIYLVDELGLMRWRKEIG
jgi:hypothetical protein